MEVRFHLAAFQTTTAAVTAQAITRREGIQAAVMPTPRTLQASCGLSIRFAPEVSAQVDRLLAEELDEGTYGLYAALRTEDGQTIFRVLHEITAEA